jgi:hypothetical protein
MPEYQILANQTAEAQKQQQVDEVERTVSDVAYFEDTPVWGTFRGFNHYNRQNNR